MSWIQESLNKKFALGTAAGLLVSSLVFLVLFVNLYRSQLENERADAATAVTRLLQTSLENAMLKRDLSGLEDIVDRLGAQSGILSVMITNPAGEIRYSSLSERIGESLFLEREFDQEPSTRFLFPADGRAVLRSINPVKNRPQCQECHGPTDQNPVNGILYVDFEAREIRAQARLTTLLLMGAGALIVVINIAGGWWFIRRFVLVPVQELSAVSQRLAEGELDARAELGGRDELSLLGERFNLMAGNLRDKIEELREKELFMQKLVDAVPDGICVIDSDFRVVLANSTYRDQLGLAKPDAIPKMCFAAAHGRSQPCPERLITCPVVEIASKWEPLRVVHRHTRADGGSLDVEIYAAPMRVMQGGRERIFVVESIRDLEQQVRFSHEQKLSELGRLAAGVAHEIHNPLAAVRMALHAVERANSMEPPDRDQVSEYLSLVDQEVEKCSHVTERLLKMSVPPPEQQELVTVDQVLDETLRLLHWEGQSRSVEIRLQVEGAPLRVLATDSDIRMLTLNLSQNAMHSMPDGGMLSVSCRRLTGRLELRFEDNGAGIDPSDRARVFEPFFSRRADGVRGTGLGLPISKSIVQNHGGRIELDDTRTRGTCVIVTFPDADRVAEV